MPASKSLSIARTHSRTIRLVPRGISLRNDSVVASWCWAYCWLTRITRAPGNYCASRTRLSCRAREHTIEIYQRQKVLVRMTTVHLRYDCAVFLQWLLISDHYAVLTHRNETTENDGTPKFDCLSYNHSSASLPCRNEFSSGISSLSCDAYVAVPRPYQWTIKNKSHRKDFLVLAWALLLYFVFRLYYTPAFDNFPADYKRVKNLQPQFTVLSARPSTASIILR